MKVELSEASAAFLKDLFHEMTTQNRRATADPYYYVVKIRKKITGLVPGHGDGTEFVDMFSGDYATYDTAADAKKALKEEQPELSPEALEREFAAHFEEFGFSYTDDREENVFLTYKGFLEHMRLNAHNYSGRQDGDRFKESEDVFSYVKHAFRNPEMQKLVALLKEIGGQL